MISFRWKVTLGFLALTALPLGWLFYLLELVMVHEGTNIGILATLTFFHVFSAGLVYSWAYNYENNLKQMTRLVKAGLDGDGRQILGMDGNTELGQLAQAINGMTENMGGTIRALDQERDKMMAILTSMMEGVVAFDYTGRIVMINRASQDMLQVKEEDAVGKFFLEILRNRELEQLLKFVLDRGEPVVRETRLWLSNPRIYRVQLVPVQNEGRNTQGAVMVLQDMSEIRRLEQVRTDFVANVSHELRTPLTSIKGFVETLRDGAIQEPETAMRFLGIINEETIRLQRLIEDLLHLSRLEGGKMDGAEEVVDLNDRVVRTVQFLEKGAQERKVTVGVKVEEGEAPVIIPADLLYQVLINLVENGIKYNQAGGQVTVTVRRERGKVYCSVTDTGIGIAEESLPRIFERFYRVDKARSRQAGGTGLGLAIVKHIVERFGGQIHVKSAIGEGTTFTFWLPSPTM